MKSSLERIEKYEQYLKDYFSRPDAKLYVIIRHISRSGMSKVLDFFIVESNELFGINEHISQILGYKYATTCNGLRIDGSGMNLNQHVADSLSYSLFNQDNIIKYRVL